MNTRVVIALTPREKEIYDLLANLPVRRWLSRYQIAEVGGKHRLSAHDFYLLDRLVDKGLIDKQVIPGTGKGKFEYCVKIEGDI